MDRIKINDAVAFLGLAYLLVLLLQMARSMYVDAYGIEGGHIDLVGYALSVGIGAALTLYAVRRRLILRVPALLVTLFLMLLSVNVAFNTEELIRAIFLSRYGILTWFLLGAWAALSVYAIRQMTDSGRRTWLVRNGAIVIFLSLIPVVLFAHRYVEDKVASPSYQIVSSNAIVIICLATIALHAFMRADTRIKSASSFLVKASVLVSGYLVYAVALMQSMSIVAFWAASLPVIVLALTPRKGVIIRYGALVLIVIGMVTIFDRISTNESIANTRLSELANGVFNVSSLQSRVELLPMFWSQFVISPVFGSYAAEVHAGLNQGQYVHSIPLSLLTHTGMVGFLILISVWWYAFTYQRSRVDISNTNGVLAIRLFLVVSLLGTIFAFFSWQPFWFFLGFMSIKQYKRPISQNGKS